MKIFCPESLYVPSPCGTARVRTAARSDPACGSVRFIVPVHSPETIFGRYARFKASEPFSSIASMAPPVSIGHSSNAMFDAFQISSAAAATRCGIPCPPNVGFFARPFQPSSQNRRYASLKPVGVTTQPSPASRAPSRSPTRFSGSRISVANLSASSRIAETVSEVASSSPGSAVTSASPASSCMTNCMSASGARYWLIKVSSQTSTSTRGRCVRCSFEQLCPYHFLVELPDAGLRNRVHEVDLVGHCVLRDRATTGEVGNVAANRIFARRCLLLADDERHRPLAPAIIGDADDGRLGNARETQDDVLDVERRHPFAAGLDDILDTVHDFQISVGIDDADVAGMQPAIPPKLLRALGFSEIALRKPGRAHDDFTLADTVVRHVVHLRVDDAQLHEWERPSGPAKERYAPLDIPLAHVWSQVRECQDRTGFGHAVAGDHVDPALDRGARERDRQRGAADDHFPSAEIHVLHGRACQHHLQDRRHAMRKSDAFAADQSEQDV